MTYFFTLNNIIRMKKLLWAAVLPLAFTACTSEDVVSNDAPVVDGNLITLNKNFALGVTKGENSSRAQYDGTFKSWEWMPTINNGEIVEVDKLGLSWIQGTDGKVYTNYEFQHFAWSVKDKTPTFDNKCTQKWTNLVFLTKDDFDANEDATNGYVTGWEVNNSVTPTATMTPVETSGYFKTANLSIFTGDYVIYSPYNSALNEVDYLKATAKDAFNLNAVKLGNYNDENALKEVTVGLGNEVFYVGAAEIKGGSTVNGFNLDPVTGMIQLNVAHAEGVASFGKKISKIAIFAEDGIVVEQAIDASKVKNNLKECLIADNTKKSSAVLVNLNKSVDFDEEAYTIFVPVLPQTIEDAKVVLFAEDGSSVLVEAGDIEVGFGANKAVDLTLTATHKLQTETYYVIDMETFRSAMVAAGTSKKETATINLLNDIVYDQAYLNANGTVQVVNDMTITGNDIIVPAGQTLKMQLLEDGNLTMDGNLVVEKECCGKDPGYVLIYAQDIEKNAYVFNGEISNAGKFQVGSTGSSTDTKVTFNDKVANEGELVVKGMNPTMVSFEELTNSEDAVITLKSGNVIGSVVATVESIENDGKIQVEEYTKLSVAESLTNNGEIAIATSGTGNDNTDGTVVIESTAAATNNGSINNNGVYDNFGTTTLNDGSEFVDFVGSQWGNKMPVVNEGAEYICEVNTSVTEDGDRFGYALGTKMPTTTVRFVSGETHEYQLKDYASYAKLATVKYIIAVEDEVKFLFKNASTNEITLGTSLVVESAKTVRFNGGKTKVNGDVTVNTGIISNNGNTYSAQVVIAGNLVMNNSSELEVECMKGATAATEQTTPSWTVNEDVELNGSSSLIVANNAAVKFNGDMTIAEKASAEFNYSSYSEVAGTITNNGTLNRVLSSESGSNANPAQVWCDAYVNNGTQVNGAPQVY